jgi:inorganic pyrophosphatase
MDNKITVFIEIEKDTNVKYEYDKIKKELIVDRILDSPFVYPYAYGFIPNTIAEDQDELDVLILSDKKIDNNQYYDVYIIGALVMEDEKGMDEKILCVFEEDYLKMNDIDKINETVKNEINYFFTNYKKKNINKWSHVIGFINKELSIELYKKSIIKLKKKID